MLSGLVYLQALAAEKYVQMNFIVAPDVPNWIHTDEVPYLPFHSKHKLRQVLVNLLGNVTTNSTTNNIRASNLLIKER